MIWSAMQNRTKNRQIKKENRQYRKKYRNNEYRV